MNFLIDETVLRQKGANGTISYVHYFFERHRLGETTAQIHADNCGVQNKNNAFMWYYLWKVMTGLHERIKYNFLLVRHTKFAPDWCFGLVKQKTRKTFISSLFDIARAVEDSASVNTAEFVFDLPVQTHTFPNGYAIKSNAKIICSVLLPEIMTRFVRKSERINQH